MLDTIEPEVLTQFQPVWSHDELTGSDNPPPKPGARQGMTKSVYVIGSLRNPRIPTVGNKLRALGLDVFDDWHAGGPEADDEWKRYETERGRSYPEALNGEAADHVFSFDLFHLNRCDAAVLVYPAGKSAHLELGYMIGQGKPGWALLDEDPDRWDVMLKFATGVFFSEEEMLKTLKEYSNA